MANENENKIKITPELLALHAFHIKLQFEGMEQFDAAVCRLIQLEVEKQKLQE